MHYFRDNFGHLKEIEVRTSYKFSNSLFPKSPTWVIEGMGENKKSFIELPDGSKINVIGKCRYEVFELMNNWRKK